MPNEQDQDRALRESDRMRILASEYKQMGFKELAKWLRKNADAAMKWSASDAE